MPQARVRLADIAKELDVSPSLVSKVLNRRLGGRSGASPTMIQAIFDKARELDYQAHAAASSLSQRRTNALAVFVHDHGVRGSELATAAIKAIAGYSAQTNQRLMLQYYQSVEEFDRLMHIAHQSTVDGLILLGLQPTASTSLNLIVQRGLPVVTVLDRSARPSFVNIGIKQERVTEIAAEHLIARGCRRLGYLGNANPLHNERWLGFQAGLSRAGLEHNPLLVSTTRGFNAGAAEQSLRHWLDLELEFDGIVAASDQLAAGAINALVRAGKRVPEDVKVIGIDNSPFCDFYLVPISSVSQQMAYRAELAFKTLMHMIEGQPAPSSTVEPAIYARASSGGPPNVLDD
jgi:DNA-binding LacI/PurR family transcriptional regulator